MHHYTECGLSYIYLKNGFQEKEYDGEQYISFTDIEGLHRAIGKDIIRQDHPITGEQLRFLRNELNYSQKQLAELLGVDSQSIARWEKAKSKPIDRPVDVVIRELYAESIDENSKIGYLLRLLAEKSEKQEMKMFIELKGKNWKSTQKMCA